MKRIAWDRLVVQGECGFRFGTDEKQEWFKFEATWNERKMLYGRPCLWWPRVLLTFLGVSIGAGIYIGAKDSPAVATEGGDA